MHISYTKSFNIPVSIAFATLAHMINVYAICLNTTNYPIFNMQGFIYCMRTSILKLFWSTGIPTIKMTNNVWVTHVVTSCAPSADWNNNTELIMWAQVEMTTIYFCLCAWNSEGWHFVFVNNTFFADNGELYPFYPMHMLWSILFIFCRWRFC